MIVTLLFSSVSTAGEWGTESWYGDTRAEACREAKQLVTNNDSKKVQELRDCECEEHKDGSWTCAVDYYYELRTGNNGYNSYDNYIPPPQPIFKPGFN